MIKLALIGYGYWGQKLHYNFLKAKGCEIIHICDTDPTRRFDDGAAFEQDYRRALDIVDAVVIATPPATHAAIATDALKAGKHVFVEKPFTLDYKSARAVEKLAEEMKLIVMVDHLLLYHPAYIALKGFISAGNLGEIYYVHGQRLGGKVRDQENVLWSLAPHDVAMGVDLFGMPDSSVALGWSYLKKHPRIEDVMYLDIYFGQEIRAHFHYSWIDQVRHRYLAVVGSEGTAVFSDTSPKNFKLYMNGDKIEYSLEGEPLQVACQKFIKCIDSGSPPRSNATMGAAVVKILEGAQK